MEVDVAVLRIQDYSNTRWDFETICCFDPQILTGTHPQILLRVTQFQDSFAFDANQ